MPSRNEGGKLREPLNRYRKMGGTGVSPESKARGTPARGSFWDLQRRVCQTMGETRLSSMLSHPFRPLPSPTFRRPCPHRRPSFSRVPNTHRPFCKPCRHTCCRRRPREACGSPLASMQTRPQILQEQKLLMASVSERTAGSGFFLIRRRREDLTVEPKVTLTGPCPDGSWR